MESSANASEDLDFPLLLCCCPKHKVQFSSSWSFSVAPSGPSAAAPHPSDTGDLRGWGSSAGEVSREQGRGEESPLSLLPSLRGSLGLLATPQQLLPLPCWRYNSVPFSSSEFSDTHFPLTILNTYSVKYTGHAYSDTHHSKPPAPNRSPELKEGKNQVSCWKSCLTSFIFLLLHNFTSDFSQKCELIRFLTLRIKCPWSQMA